MRTIPGLPTPSGTLSAYLAAHNHAFARADLLEHWSPRRLRSAVANGSASRILPGIYCGSMHVRNPVVMGEALNLWCPSGLITGALALHLYESSLPAPRCAELLVENGQNLRVPAWVRLRQAGPTRAHSRPLGIACVTPERALLDAWRSTAPSARLDLLYTALWERVCTWRELRREVARTYRLPERRRMEQVLGWFSQGATSPLEVRARYETFADARFREFEWQVPMRLGGRRPTLDILHRRAKLAVELDGEKFHAGAEARARDRARDTDLAAAGYQTVRFGWSDIVNRPEWSRQRLLAIVESRLEFLSST